MNLLARRAENASVLLPPRDTSYVLKDVLVKIVHGCRDTLILDFGDCFLRFGVDIDTDEITWQFQGASFRARKGYASVQSKRPWRESVGKPCGWTWLAVNQQGYCDSVLLGFDGVEPNILVQVIASSLEIYVVLPVTK